MGSTENAVLVVKKLPGLSQTGTHSKVSSNHRLDGRVRAPRLRFLLLPVVLAGGEVIAGCSSESQAPRAGLVTGGGSGAASAGVGGTGGGTGATAALGGNAGAGSVIVPVSGSGGWDNTGGSGDTCASQNVTAELLPVRLAFAFDVSGSMGKGDYPWHDAKLKWEPVVAAMRSFYEATTSSAFEASLTVFPTEDDKCEDSSYVTPVVPMTPLPSTEFGAALDAIRAEDWRGGTPTLHVVNGVLSNIAAASAAAPGHYVLVLVTDGYPQGCDDDEIDSVAQAVAAVADTIPTYVVGIANPPLTDDEGHMAPETVQNLTAIADAGKGQAFLIDTGDPAQTSAALSAAMQQISEVTISCNLEIPPIPGGRTFERDKVIVSHSANGSVNQLTYDETCAAPNAWHYDDPLAPTRIVLCDSTCSAVQADPTSALDVTFTCVTVIEPPR